MYKVMDKKEKKFTQEEYNYLKDLRKKNEILEQEVKYLELTIKKAQMQAYLIDMQKKKEAAMSNTDASPQEPLADEK